MRLSGCGWPSITRPLQSCRGRSRWPSRCGWPSITRPLQSMPARRDAVASCGWPSITRPLQYDSQAHGLPPWLRLALNHQTATISSSRSTSRVSVAVGPQSPDRYNFQRLDRWHALVAVGPQSPDRYNLRASVQQRRVVAVGPQSPDRYNVGAHGSACARSLRLALNHQTATIDPRLRP